MKEDVELSLPRKKEIIIYANMTEHQKQIQNHLIEETFDDYLHENMDIGMQGSCMSFCIFIVLHRALVNSILI
jgi:SNF2 family DNA or RNA helicase